MAITKIAIKNTDEVYATRSDLSKILHTSLIGDFWAGVEEYRLSKSKKILLKSIDNVPFYFVETQKLSADYADFIDLLVDLDNAYESLDDMPKTKQNVDRRFMLTVLKHALSLTKYRVSDATLKAIVSGYFDAYGGSQDQGSRFAANYRDILKKLPIDAHNYSEDLLGQHYASLSDDEELTSYFRTVDNYSQTQKLYTGFAHVYKEAPADRIETLMKDLSTFQNIDTCSDLFKAVAAGFFINYVKPFPSNNIFFAALASKTVLGGRAAAFVPWELVYAEDPRYEELSKETQLSGDLTYILIRAITILKPIVTDMLNAIAQEKQAGLEEESYRVDTPSPAVQETQEAPSDEPLEIELDDVDEMEEVDVPPAVTPVTPVKEEPTTGLALSGSPLTPSDRDIKDWARFLLETHPRLRKQQAMFFASHCAMGRYYSIQDYKKYARCVYETARTSMDNLAREKLYRKLKIKNKYLYTPIKQGENE